MINAVLSGKSERTSLPIRVTRSPARLTVLNERKQPANDILCYGLVKFQQLSPTKAIAFANRNIYTSRWNWDAEDGNDAFIVGSLDELSTAKPIAVNRSGVFPDQARDGKPRWHNRYPTSGGLVPLGAMLNGRPHPHAGTGFFLCQDYVFPISKDGTFDWRDGGDIVRELELYEETYDGTNFSIRLVQTYFDERPLLVGTTGWRLTAGSLRDATPDAEDFLLACKACRLSDKAVATGVSRWRRTVGHWKPIDFVPIAWEDRAAHHTPFESSVVRDGKGDLYFTARDDGRVDGGGGIWGCDPKQDISLWQSCDNGATWRQVIHLERARYHGPVGLGRTVDGRIFVVSNPADGNERRELRKKLALWEVKPEGKGVVAPILVRDSADFGPNNLFWTVDHPVPAMVRFADGAWHAVLGYRGRDQHFDYRTDAPIATPTPGAGAYAEEIVTEGATIPVWDFSSVRERESKP